MHQRGTSLSAETQPFSRHHSHSLFVRLQPHFSLHLHRHQVYLSVSQLLREPRIHGGGGGGRGEGRRPSEWHSCAKAPPPSELVFSRKSGGRRAFWILRGRGNGSIAVIIQQHSRPVRCSACPELLLTRSRQLVGQLLAAAQWLRRQGHKDNNKRQAVNLGKVGETGFPDFFNFCQVFRL